MGSGRSYLTRAKLVAKIERRFASMSAKEAAAGGQGVREGAERREVVAEEREPDAAAKGVYQCLVRNCRRCKGDHELGKCQENPWG